MLDELIAHKGAGDVSQRSRLQRDQQWAKATGVSSPEEGGASLAWKKQVFWDLFGMNVIISGKR